MKPVQHPIPLLLLILLLAGAPASGFAETPPVHHQLNIELDPETRTAHIEDRVSLRLWEDAPGRLDFFLNAALKLEILKTDPASGIAIRHTKLPAADGRPALTRIAVIRPGSQSWPETLALRLRYSGPVLDLQAGDTPDAEPLGVVLSGESFFYPQRIDPEGHPDRVTFDLKVTLPEGYKAVSQGARVATPDGGVRWTSPEPMEEIILIADKYHVFIEPHGGIEVQAFLLENDAPLAKRYLDATRRYLDFYSRLIAEYPFKKFALVENHRQTGYGMASFTLLGSRVIRFPFILNTSYPHEILHNWWGNSVYIDMQQGNWAEGLTAYLADHLLLDVQGQGAQYRFQELMKYLNYVHAENDFPLSAFTHRTDMASQAIGYGKTLMVLHMLKNRLGAGAFFKGLQHFYSKQRFRFAGWRELEASMQAVSGQDLTAFFKQWIQRKGAPQLEMTQAGHTKHAEGHRLTLKLAQKQQDPAFALDVPVAVWLKGETGPRLEVLRMQNKTQTFELDLPAEPGRVRVDPHTDVFRKLDRREVPPSLGETLGSKSPAKLLPAKETYPDVLVGYHQLAQALGNSGPVPGPMLTDTAKQPVPPGSLLVFGRHNRYAEHLRPLLEKQGVQLGEDAVTLEGKTFPWQDHSFVFTVQRPGKRAGSVTWIVAASGASVPGLMRKLPHYGKYGYLVFQGEAPDNRLKGRWHPESVGLGKTFHPGGYELPPAPALVTKGP